MDRIRRLFAPQVTYEAIQQPAESDNESENNDSASSAPQQAPFSSYEYAVFLLLGVSMLWAWNMFLAAAPYFYHRFHTDDWAATHYQPSILTVSTVTNLGSSFILAKLQKGASYPKRTVISLLINIVVFTLLAFSTILMKDVSVATYFAFLMFMVFGASLATGINQNGVYAYVAGFGREEYTQAIMSGQGVAGVLPCIVQIVSVLSVARSPGDSEQDHDQAPGPPAAGAPPQESSKSAFAYFLTATGVSCFALLAFTSLVKRRSHLTPPNSHNHEQEDDDPATPSKTISLWTLFKKLRFTALAMILCFTITMTFPVFTAEIESVNRGSGSRLFDAPVFIPLAFFFWNAGDLLGRMLVLWPPLSLVHRPGALLVFACARAAFIPLYQLCNIRGRGAVVQSDFFYLVVVQLLFGVSNGYLGSNCMMGAGLVAADEREPAGAFMGLMLVAGLTLGSLLSFLAAG
ncbi:nucleoside transmembrane transporter FUN26, partial [Aspergillus homomorphus CBS 101889]